MTELDYAAMEAVARAASGWGGWWDEHAQDYFQASQGVARSAGGSRPRPLLPRSGLGLDEARIGPTSPPHL